MLKKSFLISIIYFIVQTSLSADWISVQTGFTDSFKKIRVKGTNGIIIGNDNIYYTKTGASINNSWSILTPSGDANDVMIFNRSVINDVSDIWTDQTQYKTYMCGLDPVMQKAVIFAFDFTNLSVTLEFTGELNSNLNAIALLDNQQQFISVGNKGLIVKKDFQSAAVQYIESNTLRNLYALDVYQSNNAYIAGDGVYTVIQNIYYTSAVSVTAIPGNKIIKNISANNIACNDTLYMFNLNSGVINTITDYKPASLKVKDLAYVLNRFYLATSNGIYCNKEGNFGWQPTSGNKQMNDVYFFENTNEGYATGNNGTLLYTTDGGGAVKPYVQLNFKGACVNASVTFSAVKSGSVNLCKWYINSSLASTNCNFTYTFNSVGAYEIMFIGSNGFYADTAIKIFYVSEKPQINLATHIADTILCKREVASVKIDNSQADCQYNFNLYGYNFGRVLGNGSTVLLTSDTITTPGEYHIRAINIYSGCTADFTDNMNIYIENTKAAFHASYINADVNEQVNFYNTSKTAVDDYQWVFTQGTSIQTSTEKNPKIQYPSAGETSVKLIVHSENECYDTLKTKGPTIIIEPVTKGDCWTQLFDSNDGMQFDGQRYIISSKQVADGVIVGGDYNELLFPSLTGDTFGKMKYYGIFVAKYSLHGTLKWIMYSIDTVASPGGTVTDFFSDLNVDPEGNIFVTANIGYVGGAYVRYFYDNHGNDRVDIVPETGWGASRIMKFSSEGEFLWTVRTDANYDKVWTDKDGNAYATIDYYRDNYTVSLYPEEGPYELPHDPDENQMGTFLVKFSPEGKILWHNLIGLNFFYLSEEYVGVDAENNIYLVGNFERRATFYSQDGLTKVLEKDPLQGYVFGYPSYIVKYNSDGNLIWVNSMNEGIWPIDLVTTPAGDSYILGRIDMYIDGTLTLRNTQSDGSVKLLDVATLVLVKVNAQGMTEWNRGNKNEHTLFGNDLELKGDSIVLLGNHTTSRTALPGGFTSSGTTLYDFDRDTDYGFMAFYTSEGEFKGYVYSPESYSFLDFLKVSYHPGQQAYFFTGNVSTYSEEFVYLNQQIALNDNRTGFMIKLHESCIETDIKEIPDIITGNITAGQAADFSVYPNPNNGRFELNSTTEEVWSLINELGKTIRVIKLDAENNYSASIENLPNGIYIIKGSANGKQVSQKIIVYK